MYFAIHAQKYESPKVVKQLVPVYELSRHFGEIENNPFKNVLKDHREKYRENLIIQSNRVPLFGYELIDKQWFDKYKIKYNQTNLIEELFGSAYTHIWDMWTRLKRKRNKPSNIAYARGHRLVQIPFSGHRLVQHRQSAADVYACGAFCCLTAASCRCIWPDSF